MKKQTKKQQRINSLGQELSDNAGFLTYEKD